MLDMIFDHAAIRLSESHVGDKASVCPFCGEYCHVSGSFERVHYYLVEISDEADNGSPDTESVKAGERDITDRPEEGYIRTSSILRLRTKPKYPWRIAINPAEERRE